MEKPQFINSDKFSGKKMNNKTQEVNDVSIWTAKQFQFGSRTTFLHGMKLVDVFLKMHLKKTDNIVDMGCGNGNISKMISRMTRHKKIYAFDLQPSMIKFAKDNNKGEGIDYFVADAGAPWNDLTDSLKKLESTINVVYSNYVMYLIRNQNAAFENISRLLTDGGYLFINIPIIPDLNDLYNFSEEEKERNAKYINLKTKEEQIHHFNKLLTVHGLQILDVKEFFDEWTYDSKDQLLAFIQPVAKGMALKVLKDDINESEKKDLVLHYSALFEGILRNKNIQPPRFTESEGFDINSTYSHTVRYVCRK